MFELTYIHHDCFLLETADCGIVFDYWQDPLQKDSPIPGFLRKFPGGKPLYVLVSHFHKDHFNKDIFKWAAVHPEIHYIISPDVARQVRYLLKEDSHYAGDKVDPALVTVIRKPEIYHDDCLTVHAFGSTDIGNSYVVTIKRGNLRVFHAGDLNCWTWRDESTPEEVAAAEKAFRSELRPIADAYPELDVAMFPVDSRIGTGYEEGAREFVRKIKVKRFFPMHFTLAETPAELEQRRRDAIAFQKYAAPEGEYIALTNPYDSYTSEDSGLDVKPSEDPRRKEYTESYFLSAGDCSAEREMALTVLTSRLIEIATTHSNYLEIGNPFMPNDHCGWVLSRLSIEMEEYPEVDSTYSVTTWIESWNRHFSVRDFKIMNNAGVTIGYARSIWMVLDTETHANAGLDSLPFNEDMLSPMKCPIRRQAKHELILTPAEMNEDVAPAHALIASAEPAHYRFQFCDLDAYRHVNTVRYVGLLLNQFPLEAYDKKRIKRLELSFLHEGAYGMDVEILRSHIESKLGADSGAEAKRKESPEEAEAFLLRNSSDGTPILYSRMFLKPRQAPIPTL